MTPSDGLQPRLSPLFKSDPPLNCVRQARVIALAQITEPPQQKRNFIPQSPPREGTSVTTFRKMIPYILTNVIFSIDKNNSAPQDRRLDGDARRKARIYLVRPKSGSV